MSEIRCGKCGTLITQHIDCERDKKQKLIKEFLKDLNDFNWRYDIEDAGVGDWTKMIEKWEGKLK